MFETLLMRIASNGAMQADGYGLFDYGTQTSTLTSKYIFSTDVFLSATSIIGNARYRFGIGSKTTGYFAGGQTDSVVSVSTMTKYDYASHAVSSGPSLNVPRRRGVGLSNNTLGIFAGGYSSSENSRTASISKYIYSGGVVVAAAAALLAKLEFCAGFGTSFFGIIAGGYNQSGVVEKAVSKYTYAADVLNFQTNLAQERYDTAGFGDLTNGYASSGIVGSTYLSSTEKYNYANDSLSAGTSISKAIYGRGACSNPAYGLLGYGTFSGTKMNNSDKYIFSSQVVLPGASLGSGSTGVASVSSNPGGF